MHRRWTRGRDAPRRVPAALALLLLLCIPALAAPDDGQAAVDELERAYVEALDELFRWCRGVSLNATSDTVAKELIGFDPDHEKARRWLGYKRKTDRWVRQRDPPKRKDRNREAKKSYPKRRAKLLGALADRFWETYEDLQGEEAAADRRRLLALAVTRWPHDARFRKAGGEVRRNGLWILEESARYDAIAERLHTGAKDLLAAASRPAQITPPPLLRGFGPDWRGATRSAGVTVVSATSLFESERITRHCAVAVKLFRLIFHVGTELPPGFTVALGGGDADYRKVLSNPNIPEPVRKRLEGRRGFTLHEPPLVFLSTRHEPSRLDGAVRATVDRLYAKTFGDFGRLGWATEGFGTYLTWLVCRTRISSFGALNVPTRSETGGAPSRELGDDWCAGARRLATTGELPELIYLVAMDHDAMNTDDLLAAYAFAVYWVTGRPGQVQRFLARSNNGKSTPDAVREVTGMDLPALDARFRRWLRECH